MAKINTCLFRIVKSKYFEKKSYNYHLRSIIDVDQTAVQIYLFTPFFFIYQETIKLGLIFKGWISKS
jgi:hypothetical protein